MSGAPQPSTLLLFCPHLGQAQDATRPHAYPSLENGCFAESEHRRSCQPIPPDVQGALCLTREFTQCPTYLRIALSRAGYLPSFGIRSYFDFFGFQEEPFSIVPMPRYLYYSAGHVAALQGFQHLIEARQGLGVLYGAFGVGKTVLCRTLHARLSADPRYTVVSLPTPAYRSEFAMLQAILTALQETAPARSQRDLERRLLAYLVREVVEQDRTVVLIIDEAQSMRPRLLELVRRLLNYQTEETQLLQVILSGPLELVDRLRQNPALRDRAVVEYTLEPLSPADVTALIQERLVRAGREEPLFTPAATRLIYERSQGFPRRIIVLCIRSLWLAYQDRVRRIDAPLVQRAVDGLKADAPDDLAPEAANLPGVETVVQAGRSLGDWLRSLPIVRRWNRRAAPAREPEPAALEQETP